MSVLREAVSLKPFLDLTFFSFLPAHLPEEDPRHSAEEKSQEKPSVHQTIFEPSLSPPSAKKQKSAMCWEDTGVSYNDNVKTCQGFF